MYAFAPEKIPSLVGRNFCLAMASQKLTNCCVAAIALVTAAYLSTPRSSTIARLAFGAFCLAIYFFCFLAKASVLNERVVFFKELICG
jgi:hypothetical protein